MILVTVAERLKARDSAFVAAGVLALVFALLLTLPVVAAFRAQDREIDNSLYQLGLLRAEAATAPVASTHLADMQRRMDASPGAIRATGTALAQSQLQQSMESIAGGAGAAIRSTQMLPTEKANGFESVAIQYDIAVPMSRLRDLLYAIETHVPYLFIDNAQIGASQSWQAGSATAQDPPLDVRWTVRAYRWGASR